MADYRKLEIWRRGMCLALQTYKVTRALPGDERFGLTSQMRRAACSVPSNIAKGRGCGSDLEFARYLSIAGGSLNELETQTLLARGLDYIDKSQSQRLLAECSRLGRMLGVLRSQLTTTINPLPEARGQKPAADTPCDTLPRPR